MSALLVKPSAAAGEIVSVSQERAGWQTVSLRLIRLGLGQKYDVSQPAEELALVMMGGQTTIRAGDRHWEHLGARASREFPAAVIEPSSVEVEIRGGGNATRQINHIIKPGFPADRLLVVEVYTPGGNWSSYPPHKHDVHNPPGEVDLDEIYFYKISQPEGFAIQRVYTRDGRRNETLTVRDNEVVLIPDGYHPVVAAHGYDCYYLNVLAGSARSMAASDDPDYAWVRRAWNSKDARLPLVG
jgi:5-deoxy-glucuronate isomerase